MREGTGYRSIGAALAAAVHAARAQVGDPLALVALVTPSSVNGVLALQALSGEGPWIRVEAWTPARIVEARADANGALPSPPPRWTELTVQRCAATLPGWRDALVEAIGWLEASEVPPETLRAAATDAATRARVDLLADLMGALASARSEAGYASAAERAAAALGHAPGPVDRPRAVVVLGEERLAPGAFRALAAWLADRVVVRVCVPPFDDLEPEPLGLARACGDAPTVWVRPPDSDLGRLRGGRSGARDGSVVLVRAPDEVRDVIEGARAALDAVDAGVPLDRIALVMPSSSGGAVLRDALAKAGVPATWMTGPPLAMAPSARFVRTALLLAADTASPRVWFDALRQPALRLRKVLGPEATTGRGSWRRIFAGMRAWSGGARLLESLSTWIADHQDPKDVAAAGSLRDAVVALRAALPPAGVAPLGAHAARLDRFLAAWWAPTQDLGQVRALLQSWSGTGAVVPFSVFADELRAALQATPWLEGDLTDRAVRVLSPMAALGGAFDRVIAVGLAEGALPVVFREHPLLPEPLVAALIGAGHPVPDRAAQERAERRRFAAMSTSCEGRLVLSWPERTLLDGKPSRPSPLVLDALGVLLGRRASSKDLRAAASAPPARVRPDRALDRSEHELARVTADPAEAAPALAAVAWRSFALYRSPARLAAGVRDAWSGKVPPDLVPVPGLDGAPISARRLATLIADPARYFFEDMLGAWAARPLPDAPPSPLDDDLDARVVAVATAGGSFPAAWDAAEADRYVFVDPPSPHERALARVLAERRARRVVAALDGASPSEVEAPPFGDLPWVVGGTLGFVSDDALLDVGRWVPERVTVESGAPLVHALAAGLASVWLVSPARESSGRVSDLAPELRERAAWVTEQVRQGVFPWGPSDRMRLAGEHEPAADEGGA